MMASFDEPYETSRLRHAAEAAALFPAYIARLRWTRADIDREQTRALRALVTHAIEHSPWHRARLGHVDPTRLTAADLADIPSMTKRDLMTNWDSIVTDPQCTLDAADAHLAALTTDAYFRREYHVIASGGSSGHRGVFIYDWEGWKRSYVGVIRGQMDALSKARARGPFATVSAQVAAHASSAITQTFTRPDAQIVRAPATLPLFEIVDILNHAQPSLLNSYPTMLPALCEEARSGRLRIKPAFIWVTSEPLLPELRKTIEATWNVPLLNTWVSSESIGASFPCTSGTGFHVAEDLNIIEPVDERGRRVLPGTLSAKILVTNLHNHIMPLIRYEITDRFESRRASADVGRSISRWRMCPGGRRIFEYEHGVRVHPITFDSVLGKEPSVHEYRVRQTEQGAQVELISRSTVDVERLRKALETCLVSSGLTEPQIELLRVDSLRGQESGKLKRFVSLARSRMSEMTQR